MRNTIVKSKLKLGKQRNRSLLLGGLLLSAAVAGPAYAQQTVPVAIETSRYAPIVAQRSGTDVGRPASSRQIADGAAANADRSGGLKLFGQSASVTLGAGVFVKPVYEGSKKSEAMPVPLFDIRLFDDRVFLNLQDGIGANIIKSGGWRAGAAIGYGGGRKRDGGSLSRGSERLTGVPDIDGAAVGKIFGSYSFDPFSVEGAVKNRFASDGGVTVELGAKYHVSPLPRLRISLGPQITWANKEYNQTFFGVSEQTARTARSLGNNLTAYDPDAGFKDISFSVSGMYRLTDHWSIMGRAGVSQLIGSVRKSPLVEEKTQPSLGLGVMYKF